MKSGLFGFMLSAMKATFTPAPVASCCALGLPSPVANAPNALAMSLFSVGVQMSLEGPAPWHVTN